MIIEPFFHATTSTLTYVVFDPRTRDAIVIDPVLDYDLLASRTSTESVDKVAQFVERNGLTARLVVETHAHADHLSGSQILHDRFAAPIAIGERITTVQREFADIYDMPRDFRVDGSQFDRLVRDGETVTVGSLRFAMIPTPGHTPACSSILIEDAVFTGDALFIEDYGTGRTDFPMGSADALYTSVHDTLYALPDATRVFPAHDYQPNGRQLRFETTIAVSKRANVQLREETTRDEFVRFRNTRDATLPPPRLLWASVQVNIDAGRIPAPHANGRRYLRVPLTVASESNTTEATSRNAPAPPSRVHA